MMTDKEIDEMFEKMYGSEKQKNEPEYVTAARTLDNINAEAVSRAVERNLGLRESAGDFTDRREQKELDKFLASCDIIVK